MRWVFGIIALLLVVVGAVGLFLWLTSSMGGEEKLLKDLLTFKAELHSPSRPTFSPDGKRLLTLEYENSGKPDKRPTGRAYVRIWDLETGEELRRFESMRNFEPFASAAWSPEGRTVATLSQQQTGGISIWDVETGKILQRFDRDVLGYSRSVFFSGDGRRLVTGGEAGVQVWDLIQHEELRRYSPKKMHVYLGHDGFMPDGRRVLVHSDDHYEFWDAESGLVTPCALASGTTGCMCADGTKCLAIALDKSLCLLDVESGEQLRCFDKEIFKLPAVGRRDSNGVSQPIDEDSGTSNWALDSNGTRALLAIQRIEWVEDPHLGQGPFTDRPVGRGMYRRNLDDCSLQYWDLPAGKRIAQLTGLASFARNGFGVSLVISPDGRRAVSIEGKIARVWELPPPEAVPPGTPATVPKDRSPKREFTTKRRSSE